MLYNASLSSVFFILNFCASAIVSSVESSFYYRYNAFHVHSLCVNVARRLLDYLICNVLFFRVFNGIWLNAPASSFMHFLLVRHHMLCLLGSGVVLHDFNCLIDAIANCVSYFEPLFHRNLRSSCVNINGNMIFNVAFSAFASYFCVIMVCIVTCVSSLIYCG